jgi:4-carboxymuconolactone decarboxylase
MADDKAFSPNFRENHMFKHTATHWLSGIFALSVLTSTAVAQAPSDGRRFPLLSDSEMTAAQKELTNNIRSGPRASVAGSAANSASLGSPFNVFLRSPELGDHLQKVGTYIRFKSTLGARLNEFAILITARQWTSQYEWFAHHRLALQAGLSPEVADAVAQGKRPTGMKEDEEMVYNFCQELHTQKKVSDASYKAVVDKFGEQGVMDLIAVNGYYVLVSMVLNVDRTPIPGGGPLPLKDLK